ncbi:MAG TPA: amidohydrolase [Clostridia bacterium]|nr:amidohydrolase [Clostridia bacterium]
MKILIKNAVVYVNDGRGTIIDPGYVAIEGGYVVSVDPEGSLASERAEPDLVIDACGGVVIPGLVNAHTHFFQTFLRGTGEGKELYDWLSGAVWPFAKAMTEEDFYYAAMLGCVEALKGGTTCIFENHYINTSPGNADRVIEAMGESGIRGILARGYADRNYDPAFIETEDEVMAELERLLEKWHESFGGRIRVAPGPLSPVRCTPRLFKRTAEFARSNDLHIHIHVAETKRVREGTVETYGMTNVRFLDNVGLLGPKAHLVHSVWVDRDEYRIVKESGSSVVHCPVSNMYLGSGVAPVVDYLTNDINVALASDGPASNDTHDMFEVMKAAVCLQRVARLDAGCIRAEDVFHMATLGGAHALGDHQIGILSPGMKADVVILDIDKAHIQPCHNLTASLVYNVRSTDVRTVIVDGRPVVMDGRVTFIDEQDLIGECRRRAKEVMRRAGVNPR